MHSGPMKKSPTGGSPFALGWVDSVNVAWQLRDVPPGLGGFCAIPGSRERRNPTVGFAACVSAAADRLLPGADKSALPLPRERPTSIDLPQVAHVPMDAGDVLRKGDRPATFSV